MLEYQKKNGEIKIFLKQKRKHILKENRNRKQEKFNIKMILSLRSCKYRNN